MNEVPDAIDRIRARVAARTAAIGDTVTAPPPAPPDPAQDPNAAPLDARVADLEAQLADVSAAVAQMQQAMMDDALADMPEDPGVVAALPPAPDAAPAPGTDPLPSIKAADEANDKLLDAVSAQDWETVAQLATDTETAIDEALAALGEPPEPDDLAAAPAALEAVA